MAKSRSPPRRQPPAPPPRTNGDDQMAQLGLTPDVLRMIAARQPSMKRGGTVKKTGLYRLHQGERVTPAPKGAKRK